ncbi:MAG: SIR2 family NAD-dependent protein deacylase [Bacteroidales bacterium]
MLGSERKIIEAAGLIANAKHLIAFTGAGISVESGIPPFRGEKGIWSKYDPSCLDISNFKSDPAASWEVISKLFYEYFNDARPNAAHLFLTRLEQRGMLSAVITQNIDHMHQLAGSEEVIEYHGNSRWLVCGQCGERYEISSVSLDPLPPRCSEDRSVLKPDFVFFGEGIPPEAATRSIEEIQLADVLLIIGTTGEVMPAGMLPSMARSNGATIIEINTRESGYSYSITDIFLEGPAAEICKQLDSYLF